MNDDELKVMLNLLKDYYNQCINNPDSLIARTYGVFSVKMRGVTPIHVFLKKS